MSKKGSRLYECGECKARSIHHWIELNRAARLKCPACGSARMELVSKEAKADARSLQGIRVAGGTASTTLPHETFRRKVT